MHYIDAPIDVYGTCEFCGNLSLPTVHFACCFRKLAQRLINNEAVMRIYNGRIYVKYFEKVFYDQKETDKNREGSATRIS